MTLDDVAPELRRALKRLPPMPFEHRWGRALIQALLGLVPAVRQDGVVSTYIRDVAQGLRVHVPVERRSAGALLWFHGGGFIIGHPKQDDRFCVDTALSLGIPVVAVGYRLAPRHHFPAALDDGVAGWTWLCDHAAELGIDPGRIAIGGQSAGGGLAASLVQRLHDTGQRPAAQWLFCPMLDDRTAARKDIDPTAHFVWTNARNAFAWRAYLGGTLGEAAPPRHAVPARRAELDGLPPTWIGVGEIDLFLDENRAYADRLRAAGIDVTVDTVAGAPHGFEAWAPGSDIAQRFVADARAWLGRTLAER